MNSYLWTKNIPKEKRGRTFKDCILEYKRSDLSSSNLTEVALEKSDLVFNDKLLKIEPLAKTNHKPY